jgi:hypothetical protein
MIKATVPKVSVNKIDKIHKAYIVVGKHASNSCLICVCHGSLFNKATNKINPFYHHATQGAKVSTVKATVPWDSAKKAYIFVKTVFRIYANNIDKAYIVLVKMPATAWIIKEQIG